MPVQHMDDHEASPYIRHSLALGRPPYGARVHGWVAAFGGADDVPLAVLIERYANGIKAECESAGFQPHFVLPLNQQSAAAREAARRWGERVIAEGRY